MAYYVTVSNGLLTSEHKKRMGIAIWEFIWCLDKVTIIDDNKIGWILGGKPVKLSEIAVGCRDTVSRNLNLLKKAGYLVIVRAPTGLVIGVINAKKRFGKSVDNEGKSGTSDSTKVPNQIRQGCRVDSTKVPNHSYKDITKTKQETENFFKIQEEIRLASSKMVV